MPQSVPPWATWLWVAGQSDEPPKPKRCCFDEALTSLARRIPGLRLFGVLNGTMPSTLSCTANCFGSPMGSVGARLGASLDALLRGCSQVVIINNPLSGAFIAASLFSPSPAVGIHGLLGATGATATAAALRLDAQVTTCLA